MTSDEQRQPEPGPGKARGSRHGWATKSEQGVNRRLASTNTSGYRGVSRKDGRWMAYITVGGRRKHLGRFDDPVEAARVYNAAALEAWGEGVWLNPIPDAAA